MDLQLVPLDVPDDPAIDQAALDVVRGTLDDARPHQLYTAWVHYRRLADPLLWDAAARHIIGRLDAGDRMLVVSRRPYDQAANAADRRVYVVPTGEAAGREFNQADGPASLIAHPNQLGTARLERVDTVAYVGVPVHVPETAATYGRAHQPGHRQPALHLLCADRFVDRWLADRLDEQIGHLSK